MSRLIRLAFALVWVPVFTGMTSAAQYPGIGRTATPSEIAAWDIDVRPDFKGLPPGSGSVAQGQKVWDGRCASCHGTFGESNEVFTPLVGGTTAADVKSGRVKSLLGGETARTTLMKLPTISTLWDYINRAMPWDAPKSLTPDEVYAATAYLLHLGDILAADFVLSDRNIAEVQQRLPNRDGMTRSHGLWDIKGKPDVANVACVRNCPTTGTLTSRMPEHAANSHGNLVDQQRPAGPSHAPAPGAAAPPAAKGAASGNVAELARSKACLSCHAVDKRVVGPSFREIAARYKGQGGAEARLLEKLRNGGGGAWGAIPMPPSPDLAEGDAKALIRWVLGGAL